MPRKTTPDSRYRCAVHAASELLAWHNPGIDGWTPTARQIIDTTREYYTWVEISEAEAKAALAEVLERRKPAAIAAA